MTADPTPTDDLAVLVDMLPADRALAALLDLAAVEPPVAEDHPLAVEYARRSAGEVLAAISDRPESFLAALLSLLGTFHDRDSATYAEIRAQHLADIDEIETLAQLAAEEGGQA